MYFGGRFNTSEYSLQRMYEKMCVFRDVTHFSCLLRIGGISSFYVYGCMYVRMHVCMHACMHTCIYVCMRACMPLCTSEHFPVWAI